MAMMEMNCNLKIFMLNFQVVSGRGRLRKIDVNGRGLFSLCELRLYITLDF